MAEQKTAPEQTKQAKQQQPEKGAKGGKGAGQKKDRAPVARAEHTGVGLPVPPPRLKEVYERTVREKLMNEFKLSNRHEVPTMEKIVVNVGVGEAIKNAKMLDSVVEELALVTGQRPVRRRAKKSISNFGLRQGQEIGASVTLRGARMWEFMDRLLAVAIPRIRDFRGLSPKSFDGRGNYTIGVKEQMIFPEINYDMVDQIHGLDITLVTTAAKDDQAYALLRELGVPFRSDEKVGGRSVRAT